MHRSNQKQLRRTRLRENGYGPIGGDDKGNGTSPDRYERLGRTLEHGSKQDIWYNANKKNEKRYRQCEDSQRKKAPYKVKAELLRAKNLPMALYGCETIPVNESALKILQTRIADLDLRYISENLDRDFKL